MNKSENTETIAVIDRVIPIPVKHVASFDSLIYKVPVKPFSNLYAQCSERMNVIRFLSVCSIVWGHCLLGWDHVSSHNNLFLFTRAIFIQIGRIGTINFFFISGYFLIDKINQFNIISYLRHRLFTLILPWVFFLSLFVLIQIFEVIPFHQLVTTSISQILVTALKLGNAFIFHSAYWFVPASIVSAVILVLFQKHLNRAWFGAILIGITLFYEINLYHGWITTSHSKAFVGYTLFMWLGMQVKINLPRIKAFVDNLSWAIIFPIILFCFAMAAAEGVKLMTLGSADPFASIRFSNAILSIVTFLSLLKSTRLDWVNIFKPRNTVYGIYLIHCIFISQLTGLINKNVSGTNQTTNLQYSIIIQVIFFSFIMATSWVIVKAINRSPFKFIIGTKK